VALSLGEKRPGREVNHSPQSGAEVTNAWSYASTPQYAFMVWGSQLNHRGNFTFTFTFTLMVGRLVGSLVGCLGD